VFRLTFMTLLAAVVSAIPRAIAARPVDDDRPGTLPGTVPPPTWEPEPIAVDAARLALAQEWLARIADGRIDRTQLDPQLSALITDQVVSGGVAYAGPYGRPQDLVPIEIRTNYEGLATLYQARYPAAVLTWIVRTNSAGRINGMCLRRSAHNAIYRVVRDNRMGTL